MGITHPGFHVNYGWYFERQDDGSVKISAAVNRSTETITLSVAEWASVVTAVSAKGESSENYQATLRMHERQEDKNDPVPFA